MAHLPRRSIAELQARYDYEPTIQDVFVEGFFDVDLIRWFLDCLGARDVAVYPIESVDVPDDLQDGIASAGGNRTRVIRLAKALETSVESGRIVCVIDSDFDLVAPLCEDEWPQHSSSHLLATDVTSMELYLFSEKCIGKLVRLVGKDAETDVGSLLSELGAVLRQVFSVRYASCVGKFKYQWIDFRDCCDHRRSFVTFDQHKFIHRLLTKNCAIKDDEKFRARVAEISAKLPHDPTQSSHGHDFFELLRRVLQEHGILTITKTELFEGVATACIELSDLREHVFWRDLEVRLQLSSRNEV